MVWLHIFLLIGKYDLTFWTLKTFADSHRISMAFTQMHTWVVFSRKLVEAAIVRLINGAWITYFIWFLYMFVSFLILKTQVLLNTQINEASKLLRPTLPSSLNGWIDGQSMKTKKGHALILFCISKYCCKIETFWLVLNYFF